MSISNYSDIALVIKQTDKDKFLKALKTFDLVHADNEKKNFGYQYTAKSLYDDAEKRDNVCHLCGEKYFVMRWEIIKWYPTDYATKFFECPPVECDFVRVEEEAGDIETDYGLDSGVIDVYVDQHVEVINR